MTFAHPENLWLLTVIAPLVAWYFAKQRRARPTLSVSTLKPLEGRPCRRAWLRHVQFALRLGAVGCLVVILARPQTHSAWSTEKTEGTDIVVAMDVSSSMLARDFEPNRLESAKDVAKKFVSGRPDDNIGIVIFAGEALTGVPMTGDRGVLTNYIADITDNMLVDGTAIGDGLATALNRLKDGKAKSRSVILLTDGSNNTGIVSPGSAADIAKEMKIKVYTVGIGTDGMAPYPTLDPFGRLTYPMTKVEIDETTLKDIASKTGGKYFRATGNETLKEVFKEIDGLEKSEIDVSHFSHTEDDYVFWGWLAFGFFALEMLLRYTLLRSIP